jgi:outer membrane protein OmpA-like peptidoglycan-associated protein
MSLPGILLAGKPDPLLEGKEARMRGKIKLCLMALAIFFLFSTALSACDRSPADLPENVVLLASATSNEPAPELAPGDRSLLYAAGSDSTEGTAYVVNPDTGQPTTISLTPLRPDGQVEYAQPRRDQLIDAQVNQVQATLGREPASGSFDLLTEIAGAARVTSAPGTMIVISSGLSVSGAFNLIDVGWGANPQAIAAQLKSRGMIPPLTGWHLVFSGLGIVAGRQAELPLPELTTLTDYWMAICHASGAASCATDETTRPEPPSRSTTPVPVVPVPVVTSVEGPHGWSGKSLPADEFFSFGSARLLPSADAILEPLATRAIDTHALISITGYASPDGGSDAFNKTLSTTRAQSVRTRLISLGVPPAQIVQAVGLGTAGKTPSACYRGGVLDESICAQLRRVVILLSPVSTANP